MKIIGGQFRGRNFYMPAHIRPTQNMTRKALFDLIGQDLSGQTVLELFAGSGAVSLEAFSRGAKKVFLVEKDRKCLDVIKQNFELLNLNFQDFGYWPYEYLGADVFASIKQFASENQRFDIIFADPPYDRGLAKKLLKTLSEHDIFNANSLLIIEYQKGEILPESMGRICRFKQKNYGKTILDIFRITESV